MVVNNIENQPIFYLYIFLLYWIVLEVFPSSIVSGRNWKILILITFSSSMTYELILISSYLLFRYFIIWSKEIARIQLNAVKILLRSCNTKNRSSRWQLLFKIGAATSLKRDSNTGVFLWNLRNFHNTFFNRTKWSAN